jgi:hypothetical protein
MFFDSEPPRKTTGEEALQFLLDTIAADPAIIRNQVNAISDAEYALFNKTLWPAVSDPNAWCRTKTERPRRDSRGYDDESVADNPIDHDAQFKTIRHYENDVWLDNSRNLRATVTDLHGEFSVAIICNW